MGTNPLPGNYQSLGGTLVVPPQPDVACYPLRLDQFQTLRDGEMSEARSIRDACFGAFATGAVGIAGLYFTIDWDAAVNHRLKAPFVVVVLLGILTFAALVVGLVEYKRTEETRSNSTYSRLAKTISEYFNIPSGA